MRQKYEEPDITLVYFECSDIVICSLKDEVIDNNLSGSGQFGDIVRP